MVVAARYINRELALVLLVVTLVLLTVTVGGRFISYLQDAALGKYSAQSVLTILWLRLPGFLQLLLPFAFFLSILLTLGRMYAEQEFEVLRGGGVSPARLVRWLAPLALMVASAVGYFSLVLAPANDRLLTDFIRSQRANAQFNVVTPGIFHSYQRGRRVTYADSVSEDRRVLNDVFMAQFLSGEDTVTMRAEQGGQETDPKSGVRYLVLRDGVRYQGEGGRADYQVVNFKRLRQRLEDPPVYTKVSVEARSTPELMERQDTEADAELHWRLALPLLMLITALMGTGVARTKPREGRFARVVPGLGLFIAYYAALVINKDAIADGVWPAGWGMWVVHGSF